MYLTKSILDGLRILGFDKETIQKVSKEKSLEEIFLSTLFLNYIIVLVVYILGMIMGGFRIEGRELNPPFILGFLMIYPFMFNLVVYLIYGFFGIMAEMIDKRKHVKPLLSVGFHTAIVYSIIIYVIALLSSVDIMFGGFLLAMFMLYFLYTMFLAVSTVYEFSFGQTLIVLMIPFLIGGILLILLMLFTNIPQMIINFIFA